MESFFTSFYDLPLLLSKTHTKKAVNLMFHLILHVAKEPWLFLEVQFNQKVKIFFLIAKGRGKKNPLNL